MTPDGPPISNVKLMRSILILENESNSMNYEIFRYFLFCRQLTEGV